MLLGNEPSRIGVFPDGKTRARGAPSLNDLTIRSRAWANPLQQVKYQSIDWIKHRNRAFACATIFIHPACPEIQELTTMPASNEVSTRSGSDRVSIYTTVEMAKTMTRSLPLSVLTSSRSRRPC